MQLCLLSLVVTQLVVAGVSCSPHKRSGHSPRVQGQGDLGYQARPRYKKWHLEPVSVSKIAKRNQDERNTHSVSEMKESHSVFSDRNGNSQGFKQERQQVSKNGKLVSNIFHEENDKANAGENPHVEDLVEIDVPDLNIHQKIINNVPVKRNAGVSALPAPSAAELAGYVLETGDQDSVVQLLQMLQEEGKISEEEAFLYVETIKSYLEQAEIASVQQSNEEEKIREILWERKLEEEAAMEQRMEEEEEAKAAYLQGMVNTVPRDNYEENDSFLKAKFFLDSALKTGQISRGQYQHLIKEALAETNEEGLEEEPNHLSGPVYGDY